MFRFAAQPKHASADLFLKLVPQLRQRAFRAGKRIVLVLDNGSMFTAKRSLALMEAHWEWLQIQWLPRYSSEQLNEIEGVWMHLEADYFSRMLVKRRADFIAAAMRLLRSLRRSVRLRRFLSPTRRAPPR